MISGRAEVPDAAVTDLRAVGFLLLDEVNGDKLVRITNHLCGREGIIEAKHFMPKGYDLSDPKLAMRQSNRDFTNDEHFKGVVTSYLGPHGLRLSSSVFGELISRSGFIHAARSAVTVVRIVLDQEEAGHLEAALWDDGTPYENHQAMVDALSMDDYRVLGEPRSRRDQDVPPPDYTGPMTVHAVTTAVQGLGGVLSLISGGHRVNVGFDTDADEFRFDSEECPETSGNLVTVKFPHHSEVPVTATA